MADITIAGNKINPMILIIGGGGIILLVLLMRGGGGGSSALSSAGVSAEETNQALQAAREDTAAQLAASKDDMAAALRLQEGAIAAAAADSQAAGAKAEGAATASGSLAGLVASFQKALTDLQAKVAGLPTGGGGVSGKHPLDPGYTGAEPGLDEIKAWASGIGLPWIWGREFVNKFGRLPKDVPQLEEWRNIIGAQDDDLRWCIGGHCI